MLLIVAIFACLLVVCRAHFSLGVACFCVCVIYIRYMPENNVPKAHVVYGALLGICLFAMIVLFVAKCRGELPFALYGLPPNRWVMIATRYSFSVGGFIGALAGFLLFTMQNRKSVR